MFVGESGSIYIDLSLMALISLDPAMSYKSLKLNIPGVYSSSIRTTYFRSGNFFEFKSPGLHYWSSGQIVLIILT